MTDKTSEKVDALKLKEDAQALLNKETEGMSMVERVAYLEAKARKGSFADFVKKLDERNAQRTGKKAG